MRLNVASAVIGATIAVVGLCMLYGGYRWWKSRKENTFELRGDLLVRGNPDLKEVCLTFDDGPYGDSTTKILETLKAEGVHATFFLIGKRIEEHPELVRRMLNQGNEVGNHTFSHPRLDTLTTQDVKDELNACEAAFKEATGSGMKLMRPPGMRFNDAVLNACEDLGYVTVHWNVAAGDYVVLPPSTIYQRVIKQIANGSVILLHDCPQTADALPSIIKTLKAKGYRFNTATRTLARLPRTVIVATNAYSVNVLTVAKRPATKPLIKKLPVNRTKSIPRPLPEKPPTVGNKPMPTDAPTWDGGEKVPKKDPDPQPTLG